MKRALILGGGGVIGVAWETGLTTGLLQGGIDLRDADLVVGTSAGSLVGTRLAAGHDLSQPVKQSPAAVPIPEGGIDLPKVTEIFRLWSQASRMDETLCARIGQLASEARTVDQAAWIANAGRSVGVDDWPEKGMRITAVDVHSGGFEVHCRESGAPLHHAIAASCAVPGMFPPITLDGRDYMDGGVRSATSADVALDHEPDVAIVIAPICAATASFGALAERCLDDEVAQLRAAGTRVCCILPDGTDLEAFGPNLMDAGQAVAAQRAGHARGLALAQDEAGLWLD
ncbi:MAG: patatin-like phospholipase family protein [Deltaproteobacteria bacterium]|nr:patatin-like phospholipase family protein [Deltaproteobacteria bacterium]